LRTEEHLPKQICLLIAFYAGIISIGLTDMLSATSSF